MKIFKKWWFWVVVVVVVIAVANSGGNDTSTPTKAQPDTQKPQNSNISSQKMDEKTRKDLAELKTYLKDNFTGTSWYNLIKDVQLIKNKNEEYSVVVKSSIYHDDEGEKAAEKLFPAFLGWGNDQTRDVKVSDVTILDKDGNALIRKDNPIQK
ncbi:hypothetical protein [Tepidibacillus fermentans]|uniref:Uncharacterized protein n=1 Tax=Tepidibacillus fermentans TaxID=1281767 RepID=A0A4R3KB37_9BACI|nr:hypothetical protein [Tepidibacillus fermentans]TCS80346.1 hypothetical protein EDD72_11713 [Tepidibacillus fermentans]